MRHFSNRDQMTFKEALGYANFRKIFKIFFFHNSIYLYLYHMVHQIIQNNQFGLAPDDF